MTQFPKLKTYFLRHSLFIILSLLLVVFYFLSRLIRLTIIPVFVDEAIYIRWAQVMKAVASLRFLPLSDGKQPLFMWLVIPFLKVVADPLAAGRLVSVLAGLGTMVGIFVLSQILFKKKEISLFASLLYLISPFAFFFDRLALADGLLSFFGVWVMVGAVGLAKEKRLDLAMITGILLGLGLITKSPALFFALLLPTTLLLFNFQEKSWPIQLTKLVGLWGVVYFFGIAIYSLLRLGPEFHMIAIRNKDYIFSFREVLAHPLNPFWGNLKSAAEWFRILLTPLCFIGAIAGGVLVVKRHLKEGALLWLWLLVPLLGQSAIAKVYTARYVLFTVPFLLIFAAYALTWVFLSLKSKLLAVVVLVLIFFFPVYQLALFLVSPQKAWLPANERSGYLEIWTAGYGIKEAADYLKTVARSQKVLVGTEGYFGTLPDGLQLYLEGVPNITIIGVGQPIKEVSSQLTNGLKDNRVFLLVNNSRFLMTSRHGLRLLDQYPKAADKNGKRENLLFFEVVGQ
jgi:4-amino-4-deoxy-L-arabinose transferase-like glycosyltransferase